jgi:hypothetical protein
MSEKSKLLALTAMAFAFMGNYGVSSERLDKEPPKEPPIPKGCKVYWFTQAGELSMTEWQHPIVCYKIIALNEKSARRKFKNLPLAF